jgi:LacI family transcriptional regulator
MVNIADVAKLAGVSTATVSRVINNNAPVADATRRRVDSAIDELGYESNNLGRNMRVKHLQLVGLVVSDVENPFFTSVTRGIEDQAHLAGFGTILCNSDENVEKESQYLATLRAERVPGVIVAPVGPRHRYLERYAGPGLGMVTIGRRVQGLKADLVATDNALGGESAAAHLSVQHGYDSVGLVGGPPGLASAEERSRAFLTTITQLGVQCSEEWIEAGDMREESGYESTSRILSASQVPRAVFVVNNLMTLGSLRAAREHGLKVPDDLAIIGFDDVPWAPYLDPPLTVISQPTQEIGREAAKMLFDRLDDPARPAEERRLAPTLLIRRSCGCGE